MKAAEIALLRLWPLMEQHISVDLGLYLPRQFRSTSGDTCVFLMRCKRSQVGRSDLRFQLLRFAVHRCKRRQRLFNKWTCRSNHVRGARLCMRLLRDSLPPQRQSAT